MATKFSQDVVPLSAMKANLGRIVRNVNEAHRSTLLTWRGIGVAIVQALDDYEHKEEEIRFMRAVVQGLADVEAGREATLADAKRNLELRINDCVAIYSRNPTGRPSPPRERKIGDVYACGGPSRPASVTTRHTAARHDYHK